MKLDELGHVIINNITDTGGFILSSSDTGGNNLTINSRGSFEFGSVTEVFYTSDLELQGKILIPDLQFYFNQILTNGMLNQFSINKPSFFPIEYLEVNNSFVRLLFDDTWPVDLNVYTRIYLELIDKASWPHLILTRLMMYPSSSRFFISSDSNQTSSLNVFHLIQDDLTLLDMLLSYRTNIPVNLIDVDFNSLRSNLSQMIYLYLNLKINNDYSLYDNVILMSNSNNILENAYESYLAETMFSYVQSKEILLAILHNEIIS
jgi:hypothetical protein